MIKRKVRTKVRKRKNPLLTITANKILRELDPINKIDFKFIGEGGFGETYYFKLEFNKLFRNTFLKPGKYLLKIFFNTYHNPPNNKEINYLTKLSKYGLIPKIFIINQNFIIMKYIEGETLYNLNKNHIDIERDALEKIDLLVKKWHELGFAHGDLSENNILITKSDKVYFIDPYYLNNQEFKYDLDRLEYYWNKYYD